MTPSAGSGRPHPNPSTEDRDVGDLIEGEKIEVLYDGAAGGWCDATVTTVGSGWVGVNMEGETVMLYPENCIRSYSTRLQPKRQKRSTEATPTTTTTTTATTANPNAPQRLVGKPREDFLTVKHELVDEALGGMGVVDQQMLTPGVSPAAQGGQPWPNTRQGWRVVQSGDRNSILICSDGLSDPCDWALVGIGPTNGLGLEILLEAPAAGMALPLEMSNLQQHWMWRVVYEMSQQAAGFHTKLREGLDKLGVLSVELSVEEAKLPERYTLGVGRHCFLLGQSSAPWLPKDIVLPDGGTIRFCTMRLLTVEESQRVIRDGAVARQELAREFEADGTHHVCPLVEGDC